MKYHIQTILIISTILISLMYSCNGPDPILPTHKFFVKNNTDTTITVNYKFIWSRVSDDTLGLTTKVASRTTIELASKDKWLYMDERPSLEFKQIIVLNNNGDTILNQNPIDDSKWICEPHIDDYGYIVTNNYWTLVVGE